MTAKPTTHVWVPFILNGSPNVVLFCHDCHMTKCMRIEAKRMCQIASDSGPKFVSQAFLARQTHIRQPIHVQHIKTRANHAFKITSGNPQSCIRYMNRALDFTMCIPHCLSTRPMHSRQTLFYVISISYYTISLAYIQHFPNYH